MGVGQKAEKRGRPSLDPAPVRDGEGWEVYVYDLSPGSTRGVTTLRCLAADTVSHFRRRLADAWRVNPSAIRLLLQAQELTIYDDESAVGGIGIIDGTTVDAVLVTPPTAPQQGWFARMVGQIIPSLAPCCKCDQADAPPPAHGTAPSPPPRRGPGVGARRYDSDSDADDPWGGGAAAGGEGLEYDGERLQPEKRAPIDSVIAVLGPSAWPCGPAACRPLPPLGADAGAQAVVALVAAVFARAPAVLRDIRAPNNTQERLQQRFAQSLAGTGTRMPGYMPPGMGAAPQTVHLGQAAPPSPHLSGR